MINTTTDYLVLIATIYWSKYPIFMVIVGSGVASSYNLSDLLSSSNTQIIALIIYSSINYIRGWLNEPWHDENSNGYQSVGMPVHKSLQSVTPEMELCWIVAW